MRNFKPISVSCLAQGNLHRITASPHHRITASPHHRITASPHHRITAQLTLLVFSSLFFLSSNLLAQPGNAQWSTSVNVGNSGSTPPGPWADWIIGAITTRSGNTLGVGFAKEDEQSSPSLHVDVPSYCLISPTGALLRDEVIEDDKQNPAQGRLSEVEEGSGSYYYAVGSRRVASNRAGLLILIDKVSLDYNAIDVFPSDPNFPQGRIVDISIAETISGDIIFCTGQATNSSGGIQQWVLVFDQNGNLLNDAVLPSTFDLDEVMNASQFVGQNGGKLEFFYSSYVMKNKDGGFGQHRRHDSDIQVGLIRYDLNTGQFSFTSNLFNSINQGSRNETADAQVSPGDIFFEYPPILQDQYAYGPKYIGTSFERDFANCNEPSSTNGFYIEDWSDGSEDVPYSLVVTNDKVVVSALLNRLIMWEGTNDALGGDNAPGVQCSAGQCASFDGHYYLWGEAYLLFFNRDDLTLQKATHLGTYTGGDFLPKMIQTADGGFAVVGTVTGCPEGLDPVTGKEHMMAVRVDADGNLISREHYNGRSDGSCGFAIVQAPDGNIIVAGNSEGENGNSHEENYLFIKTSSECHTGVGNILPNSGQDFVVTQNTIWNQNLVIGANVVVPNGVTLRIEGTANQKVNMQFVDSKEVFGYDTRTPIGIRVEKGGRLIISYANLSGLPCNGVTRMWDGIVVNGDPSVSQNPISNQGSVSISLF